MRSIMGYPTRRWSRSLRVREHSGQGEGIAQSGCGNGFYSVPLCKAAANRLTHAALDPICGIPEFKVCAGQTFG